MLRNCYGNTNEYDGNVTGIQRECDVNVTFLGKLFMDKESDADEDAVVETLNAKKRNLHGKYNKGIFSEKEEQIINENWNQFQKEYKFYDLRPLINYRTCILEGSHDSFSINQVYLTSVPQQKKFLNYIRRGLNRSLMQVKWHLQSLVLGKYSNCAWNKGINFAHQNIMAKKEMYLVDLFLKRYGVDVASMEFILNSTSGALLHNSLRTYYRFKLCPIADGPWTEEEMLRLIKGVVYTWNKVPTQNHSHSLNGTKWMKVFLFVRVSCF
ncbi:uncharacterized protein LOC108670538 [Hyalella azteca]|uniref:Uncharacterized protein LOC108670538 n=1 Tax=Hyalella azteca TaxID=294128 RepID=A0A979FXS8_HYAAZ|nr:uncharacterized protein LOC108670538 [Hyalella azteca]